MFVIISQHTRTQNQVLKNVEIILCVVEWSGNAHRCMHINYGIIQQISAHFVLLLLPINKMENEMVFVEKIAHNRPIYHWPVLKFNVKEKTQPFGEEGRDVSVQM